jgi:hypothetical protein
MRRLAFFHRPFLLLLLYSDARFFFLIAFGLAAPAARGTSTTDAGDNFSVTDARRSVAELGRLYNERAQRGRAPGMRD